jgi:hypothetical protein
MNFIETPSGLSIGRDSSDKLVKTESALLSRLICAIPSSHRFNPSLHGLTSCTFAIRIPSYTNKPDTIYWHARYQIESASDAFNSGSLFLDKA